MNQIERFSKAGAIGRCSLITLFFVAVLYTFTDQRKLLCGKKGKKNEMNPEDSFHGDHPKIIIQRMICISVLCVIIPLWLRFSLSTPTNLLVLLGIKRRGVITSSLKTLLETSFPYLGLFVMNLTVPDTGYLNDYYLRSEADTSMPSNFPLNKSHIRTKSSDSIAIDSSSLPLPANVSAFTPQSSLVWWRNYVVSPFAEELVFRACLIPYFHYANFSRITTCFIAPLFFSGAHLHHSIVYFHSTRKQGRRIKTRLQMTIMMAAGQFAYTYLFGIYATFLFLRTNQFFAVFLSHSFCNRMGLPLVEDIDASARPNVVKFCFVLGFILFLLFLFPLTSGYVTIYA